MDYVVSLDQVSLANIHKVGGKNASTGEMLSHLSQLNIKVPNGFATTVTAYKKFLAQNDLDKKIERSLATLKLTNISALNKTSQQIRKWIIETPFFPEFEKEVAKAYSHLKNCAVAVRSSATTEDLTNASFAGAQETFLNVKGLKNVLHAIKLVFASLFTSRAINYRHEHGFKFDAVALSVGIQPMIRSDKGCSGVMFTIDTESGFDKTILIAGSYGLGEAIVQGQVNPDEFIVYKPALLENELSILQRNLGDKAVKMIYASSTMAHKSIKCVPVSNLDRNRFCLTDKEIQTLAYQALLIEKYYGKPMDIEWAKDGITNELYILQARPETVKSQAKSNPVIERYALSQKSKVLATGQAIGQNIGQGKAHIILDTKKLNDFKAGEVLVTDMTDPDWEPIMKRASAIVTNRGGRTCHAAIIARELGIPAVIGCGDATKNIKNKAEITVSCAEGHTGYIYSGKLPFTVKQISVAKMPPLPIKLCLNIGNPSKAFTNQLLPNDGVGLARLEFIISDKIGIHPNAILNYKKIPKKIANEILKRTSAYRTPTEFYIEKLREGISTIAAAFNPKEVIFRFSDFKTNEYANLIGGELYEAKEENPMLGFRGASRYKNPQFKKCFELECEAFKRVRDQMGLTNAQVMVPFVRTVAELKEVINLIEANGLERGKNGLKIYMMCEVPSNALLADEFLQYVDGFSIGSNDLTQLTLGLDRDSSSMSSLFDERDEAVKSLIRMAITACKKSGKYIGICGQAPSDHLDFAKWLMSEGIQGMSLNPDTIVETWLQLSKKLKETA